MFRLACCGVLNVPTNQRQSAALSIGCPELCRLSFGGIPLVGGARGLHLLDRSSNRRASSETPTPKKGTKCTFNMRTKKCGVFVRKSKKWGNINVPSCESGIIISIQHTTVPEQVWQSCVAWASCQAQQESQKNRAASNPPLITTVGGTKLPLQLLTEASEMFHFCSIIFLYGCMKGAWAAVM